MTFGPYLDALFALSLVVVAILLLGRLARRFRLPFTAGGTTRSGRLSVESALPIDPKRRVVIVRCDGRDALLLLAPTGDILMGWLDGERS